MKYLIASGLALAVSQCAPALADETTAAAVSVPPSAIVGDARLDTLRGKYVPADASGLATGTIVYFGLDMTTNWTNANTTYAADVDVRLGVSASGQPSLTIATTASQRGDGSAAPNDSRTPGAIVGASPTQATGASGILQAIQIAGNGNAVDNRAALTITAHPVIAGDAVAGGGTCAACTFVAGPAGIGVAIALPGGNTASQLVGPSGVAQSARIISNGNTVANDLHLVLGVSPGAAAAAPVFVPPLAAAPIMVIH